MTDHGETKLDGDDAQIDNLRVSDSFDDTLRVELIKQLGLEETWPLEMDMSDLRPLLKSLDPAVLPIVNIAVAVATLGYIVWKDWRDAKKWTEQKLRDHLATELAAKDIVGFEIIDVNNFDEFRRGKELCVVKGTDRNGKTYRVWLLLDGNVGVLEIESE